MIKRTPAQTNASRGYATRSLRQHNHTRKRVALGRKLNLPTDKAGMRSEAIALTGEIIQRWQSSPHYKPGQSLAEFVHRYGYDDLGKAK
jgi:hypothetical protein